MILLFGGVDTKADIVCVPGCTEDDILKLAVVLPVICILGARLSTLLLAFQTCMSMGLNSSLYTIESSGRALYMYTFSAAWRSDWGSHINGHQLHSEE